MSTKLKIWTAWNKEPREQMISIVCYPPLVKIRVYMELTDDRGRKGLTLIWNMKAEENHDEQAMRRDLLQSTWWEKHIHINSSPDLNNITDIQIDDEMGLLQWLCPGQDLKDFFKQQNAKQLNDQPLRLPA